MWIGKFVKHGDSTAVLIPASVCRGLGIEQKDYCVGMVGHNGNLIITKLREQDLSAYKQLVDEELSTIQHD